MTGKCAFRLVAGYGGKGTQYNDITSAEEMERTCMRGFSVGISLTFRKVERGEGIIIDTLVLI